MRCLAPLLLLVARAAWADDDLPPDRWYPRVTGGVGVGLYIGDVADAQPTGMDLRAELEVRIATTTFVAASLEHALAHVGRAGDIPGPEVGVTGAQLALREVVMGVGSKHLPYGSDLYVLGGVERETQAWEDGSSLRRIQAVIGFGSNIVLYRDHQPRGGVTIDMRYLIGRAPDPGKVPLACDGPCDRATRTAPYDHSFVLELTCRVGR